jgi:hypothetical protein
MIAPRPVKEGESTAWRGGTSFEQPMRFATTDESAQKCCYSNDFRKTALKSVNPRDPLTVVYNTSRSRPALADLEPGVLCRRSDNNGGYRLSTSIRSAF